MLHIERYSSDGIWVRCSSDYLQLVRIKAILAELIYETPEDTYRIVRDGSVIWEG